MDKGQIIVLSISQEFPGERKAVFMLMKLAAYRHGKRRFDLRWLEPGEDLHSQLHEYDGVSICR